MVPKAHRELKGCKGCRVQLVRKGRQDLRVLPELRVPKVTKAIPVLLAQ